MKRFRIAKTTYYEVTLDAYSVEEAKARARDIAWGWCTVGECIRVEEVKDEDQAAAQQ